MSAHRICSSPLGKCGLDLVIVGLDISSRGIKLPSHGIIFQ